MIGRPREFDAGEALGQAMEVFWHKGYEGTSVQDLLNGMGINRGSMYDTFGDKRSLFLKTVEHYRKNVVGELVGRLTAPGSPLGNIRQTLSEVAKKSGSGDCRGCLLTNTAVETAPHDAEVAEATRSALRDIEKAFKVVLGSAVEAGELQPKADTRALARFLTATLQGLVVIGKAKLGKSMRDDIVRVTMRTLQ